MHGTIYVGLSSRCKPGVVRCVYKADSRLHLDLLGLGQLLRARMRPEVPEEERGRSLLQTGTVETVGLETVGRVNDSNSCIHVRCVL